MRGAYGLALGLMIGVAAPLLTRTRHFPLADAKGYRSFITKLGPVVVGGVATLGLPVLLFFLNRDDSVSLTSPLGGSSGSVLTPLVLIVLPAVILALASERLGHHMADWYEREALEGPEDGSTPPNSASG